MKLGIVGAAGRGKDFKECLEALRVEVQAVCDVRADELAQAQQNLGAALAFTDYSEMLERGGVDAVLVATPMHLHASMAIAALERNVHVLSEVTAGVSIDECKKLVEVASRSQAVYMMAENYCYTKPNAFVHGLVTRGEFGEVYYAEGEYLHEVRELTESTPWRRTWQLGVRGVTYCTHSLGPILQWFGGDRVTEVSCVDAGSHYTDPRGDSYASDCPVMLCRTAQGRLIKLRVDLVSNRPHAMQNYMLQGTQGSYESSRADGDPGRIWLSSLSSEPKWFDPNALMADESMGGRALPPRWWRPSEQALRAGHGGGDYFVLEDFLAACRGERPVPIGILEAMDMTLPGLVSQQSVLEGGRFIAVPDARAWAKGEAPRPQLEMVLSERALENPPPLTVPPGYVLRQFEERDAESYLALLELSGLAKWDRASLESFRRTRLPGGFFVVEHCATGAIAATAMASHSPNAHHPNGGCIDWVAAHPEHKGKALGAVASIAAVRRLIEVGYRRIYLLTDDFRIPAIKTYLRMGYEPFIWDDAMQARWDAIRRAVN